MSNSVCRVLEQDEYDIWDEFVANSPQGTIFHKSYWLKASGRDFKIYGYFKGSELFGGLPICYGTKLGFRIASHPPLTPYLGVLFKQSDSKYVTRISNEKEINRAFAERIKRDFDIIVFRFSPLQIDIQPFIWEGFSTDVRYTYILDLDDLDDVWMGMDSKRRNHIIKAEKDGIYVEINDDFQQTFTLVEKTFVRQGKIAVFRDQAFKYNEILIRRGQCKSFLAKNKLGKSIAAVYIIWDEKRSYCLLSGYDSENSHHGALALAMWEAIKYTKNELGLNEYDFEGSMIQTIEESFREFGGKIIPCYLVTWMKPHLEIAWHVREIAKVVLHILKMR
ncbi:TPA: GNAT family N-acetyltransferase [Candidatus Poribacteria bacterium]|nr:GNAT family N-acetyltransferase [Candidatus Poribacteria bacterium]